jgi:hypothetical protein
VRTNDTVRAEVSHRIEYAVFVCTDKA